MAACAWGVQGQQAAVFVRHLSDHVAAAALGGIGRAHTPSQSPAASRLVFSLPLFSGHPVLAPHSPGSGEVPVPAAEAVGRGVVGVGSCQGREQQ